MAEAFPVSGNIESASFPYLLVDLYRHGATGSLKVTGALHPKALYFRAGRILFGSSNDPRDQLGSILIESQKITREQLDEVNAKVGPGNPLAKILAESGFVNQREIGEAAREKLERILSDALSWETGSFEFEDGVLPKNAPDLKQSTERLLLSAVQRIADREFALRHVELSAVLEPVPEGEAILSEVRAEVWPLLERLDGERSLKDAIGLTRLDEFEAAKTACALLFLGVVRKTGRAGEEVDLAQEAQSGFGTEAPLYAAPLPTAPPLAPPTESTGFAFAEPESESRPFPDVEPEPEGAAETVMFPFPQAFPEAVPEPEASAPEAPAEEPEPFAPPSPRPEALPDAPSFTTAAPPWGRKASDTVPGDQPVYEPPAPVYEPSAPVYEPSAPVSAPSFEPPDSSSPELPTPPPPASSRPTPEDLAALDALLNPSASGRGGRSPVEPPSRSGKWEPQFRPPTTPPRRAPVRASRSSSSRVPLIAAGLLGVLIATVGAWYYFRRGPAPTPPPSAAETPAPLAPPPTVAAAAEPEPTPLAETPADAGPTAAPVTATPAPAPTQAPTPVPTPTPTPGPAARPSAAAAGGDARALLRQGDFPGAARSFATMMAGSRGRFSLQLLVACAPDTVQKAASSVPAEEFFILPVVLNGRACYRLCWGVYDDRPAAEGAVGSLPAYFRQGGVSPRVTPIAELLP